MCRSCAAARFSPDRTDTAAGGSHPCSQYAAPCRRRIDRPAAVAGSGHDRRGAGAGRRAAVLGPRRPSVVAGPCPPEAEEHQSLLEGPPRASAPAPVQVLLVPDLRSIHLSCPHPPTLFILG